MVSLCLEPEITLSGFSSTGSKNRGRLFQTKRQKIGLWWSFIMWGNEQMWNLLMGLPHSYLSIGKGHGRTPAEKGQGSCCMWPSSDRTVNGSQVCSDQGPYLRSPVIHFEDKVGQCHCGITWGKRSFWSPVLEPSRKEIRSVFVTEAPGGSKKLPGVVRASWCWRPIYLPWVCHCRISLQDCSKSQPLPFSFEHSLVHSLGDINHWDINPCEAFEKAWIYMGKLDSQGD